MTTIQHQPQDLRELLLRELQHGGIDLTDAYIHDWSGCNTLALPVPASPGEIWLSDHDAQLDDSLADYTGILANLETQGYGGESEDSVTLYESTSRDPAADVRRLVGVLRPLLMSTTVDELLLDHLAQAGISTGVQLREGRIEGVPIGLADGTHLFVTDANGTSITHPLSEHTGLLVNHYRGEDLSTWSTVYDSPSTNAVADVVAAVAAITGAVRRSRRT